MKVITRKAMRLLAAFVMVLCVSCFTGNKVYAISTITGNNNMNTAYNFGSWSGINSNSTTIILEAGENESWIQFSLNAGDHIYIRASYDSSYAGEWFEIKDSSGNTVGTPQYTPGDVYNPGTITPDIYLDVDNSTSSTRTYYMVLHRGTVNTTVNIYYSISAYNRIRTSSINVSVSGTANNPGNSGLNPNGVDSTVITTNLTNNNNIPANAIVTSITSSGTQSPSQGNVHHMIMPNSNGTWYTSTVASASSGHYNINLSDNIPVKQLWSFKYNALATAKSKMTNVHLMINYQYDMHDTNYEIFVP